MRCWLYQTYAREVMLFRQVGTRSGRGLMRSQMRHVRLCGLCLGWVGYLCGIGDSGGNRLLWLILLAPVLAPFWEVTGTLLFTGTR